MSRFPDGIPAEVITVVARRVLLDALEALQAQRDAITLVGAQAVHLRIAAGGLTTASYTSDAHLGVDPVGRNAFVGLVVPPDGGRGDAPVVDLGEKHGQDREPFSGALVHPQSASGRDPACDTIPARPR